MSEVPNELAFDDTSEVGTTSVESSGKAGKKSKKAKKAKVKKPKKPKKAKTANGGRAKFDLFNTILLISFLFITLAFMLMVWHLFDRYGAIWDAPWNV